MLTGVQRPYLLVPRPLEILLSHVMANGRWMAKYGTLAVRGALQ